MNVKQFSAQNLGEIVLLLLLLLKKPYRDTLGRKEEDIY